MNTKTTLGWGLTYRAKWVQLEVNKGEPSSAQLKTGRGYWEGEKVEGGTYLSSLKTRRRSVRGPHLRRKWKSAFWNKTLIRQMG